MQNPVLAQLLAVALIVAIVALAVVAIPIRRGGAPISARGREERGWYGFIYANPDDPHLIVPKRLGLGWTINFGHRRAWQTVFGLLAFIAVSVVVYTLAGANGQSAH
ncbi:DUF5808 domain-containing protein [Dactylosporangium sp. CA-092794]|uniref:DUF5808 domain-containing protein n=1 Tax=Dactylosporangium sp. CA-092794 TaxID=3239929 RepID=UPI003D8F268E